MNPARASVAALLLLAAAPISPQAAAQSPSPTEAASPMPAPSASVLSADQQSAWSRWRAERRAARQERQAGLGGGGGEGRGDANHFSPGQPGPAVQRFLEQLPPGERESFLRNFKRWRELSPQERETLRGQAGRHRARMLEEAGRALQESGLKLSDDRREMFLLRYSQERRKLERELREKAEEERARRLPAIHEALKREFATPPANNSNSAGPAPSAAVAPTPAR